MLHSGKFDDRYVDLEVSERNTPMVEIFSNMGMEEVGFNFKDMLGGLMPKNTKKRKVKVSEAMEILTQQEAQGLVDMEKVVKKAVSRVEESGIVFLDEIDKIAVGGGKGQGPDVSREGVQRDLLPIVEGTTVNTKYGMVKTDHILFIASGAFHMTKPSDLTPELQGRFPIRVELDSLTEHDFVRILTEPKNAIMLQYEELLKTEGVEARFYGGRGGGNRLHRQGSERQNGKHRRPQAAYGYGMPAGRHSFRRPGGSGKENNYRSGHGAGETGVH